MPLTTPHYIVEAGIATTVLKYKWDDWKLDDVFETESQAFHDRMSRISFRANIAFTNACGEWIVHRYDLLSTDPVPLQNMEAAWAGLISPSYSVYWEPPDDEWRGPIRGALSLAIIFSLEAIGDAYHYTDPAVSSDRASNLAEHIIHSPGSFQTWRERVVERLERLYPLDEDDPLGNVVPREALDPEFDFHPEMSDRLVQTFLSSLSPMANPFLRTPEQMIKDDFVGTPYHFDIEADRIARNDY
jgi:hypothetical protein